VQVLLEREGEEEQGTGSRDDKNLASLLVITAYFVHLIITIYFTYLIIANLLACFTLF
jgi:Trk-type K+ transport system membrane component